MKTKLVTLLLALSFLALALPAGVALADSPWSWDGDRWDDGWAYQQHRYHHRHQTGRWYGRDLARRWDRGTAPVYRATPRYDRPRISVRPPVYRDRRR